ncbi:hypothetical protein GGF50DRAFT_116083 [Schizophyllum commune]
MAMDNLSQSQRFDFSEVAPWIGASAPSPRARYVPNLSDELWESDLNGYDAIAPYADDLRAALADIKRDFEIMRKTRAQIADLLRDVDARIGDMKQVITRCRSRLSPVHKLPPELLVTIFHFCVAGEAIPLRYDIFPGLLAHVCRRWRLVAHGAPWIWTNIDATANLSTSDTNCHFSAGASRILSQYLRYSQNLPLSIRCYDSNDQKLEWDIICKLLAERHRIHNLSIISMRAFITRYPSWLTRGAKLGAGFPNLMHLDLSRCPSTTDFRGMVTIFPAPALRSVRLPTILEGLSDDLQQALKGTTTYVGPLMRKRTNLLKSMPALEHCTIKHYGRPSDLPVPHASLHRLRVLSLKFFDAKVFEAFRYLRAPHLRSLSIWHPCRHCNQIQQLIAGLECQTTLIALYISLVAESQNAATILRACPGLRTLEVRLIDSAARQEDTLVFGQWERAMAEDDGLLTHLRVLRIANVSGLEGLVQNPAFQRFIQRAAARQLTKVEFCVPKQDVDRLRVLVHPTYASLAPTTTVIEMQFCSEWDA